LPAQPVLVLVLAGVVVALGALLLKKGHDAKTGRGAVCARCDLGLRRARGAGQRGAAERHDRGEGLRARHSGRTPWLAHAKQPHVLKQKRIENTV